MIRGFLAVMLVAGSVSLCCCKGKAVKGDIKSETQTQTTSEISDDSLCLPMPNVPVELQKPEEKAAYVSMHFWDTLDFERDIRSRDTTFMEQNFANYLAILSVTPEHDVQKAVSALLDKAYKSTQSADMIRYVAERYLDDPNSPMRNEDLYIYFLREWSKDSEPDAVCRLRAQDRLAETMKNRRGTQATDFSIIGSNGQKTTLLKTLKGKTIVMFFDPDCEQCKESKKLLSESNLPDGVSVMTIDITGDRKRFEQTKNSLPIEWTRWLDNEGVEKNEKYVFMAMPTFYVLDQDGTVLMKDPPVEVILNMKF